MDQPQSEHRPGAGIRLTPAMRPVEADGKSPRRSRLGASLPVVLGGLGVLLGLAALASAAWLHVETRREVLRLSTDLAQLRVSLDLYARSGSGDASQFTDLSNRLAILEQNWRGGAVPAPATAPGPANGDSAEAEDCLPAGMRLLVAAGDRYPVCGQDLVLAVETVDNGYVALAGGTIIPSGGSVPLPPGPCTIGVTSGGDEGLTGYAEIRVNC
ncbi:hypothetical protein ACFOOL_04235 [Devosia honganensis]|uniref:Type 4 secretion system PilS N-terminal domain-containing protein n=1 Tax=Devosia honganensis TaxID=1610527 RepID=A0ABV7WXC8_9HYPH